MRYHMINIFFLVVVSRWLFEVYDIEVLGRQLRIVKKYIYEFDVLFSSGSAHFAFDSHMWHILQSTFK